MRENLVSALQRWIGCPRPWGVIDTQAGEGARFAPGVRVLSWKYCGTSAACAFRHLIQIRRLKMCLHRCGCLYPELKPTVVCKLGGGKNATWPFALPLSVCRLSGRAGTRGQGLPARRMCRQEGVRPPLPHPSGQGAATFLAAQALACCYFPLWISPLLFQEWSGTLPRAL